MISFFRTTILVVLFPWLASCVRLSDNAIIAADQNSITLRGNDLRGSFLLADAYCAEFDKYSLKENKQSLFLTQSHFICLTKEDALQAKAKQPSLAMKDHFRIDEDNILRRYAEIEDHPLSRLLSQAKGKRVVVSLEDMFKPIVKESHKDEEMIIPEGLSPVDQCRKSEFKDDTVEMADCLFNLYKESNYTPLSL